MAGLDPLNMIQPSEPAHSEVGMDDVPAESVAKREHHEQMVQVHLPSSMPGATPVTLTPKGIMSFLGRKDRPRPLLRLACKACGLSTHDIDPIVNGVCME